MNSEWKKGDGGEIRFYPFPYDKIDIEPLNDRLVFFSSHQMMHRVMPSQVPRYCLSNEFHSMFQFDVISFWERIALWFSGSNCVAFPRKMELQDPVLAFLLNPKTKVQFSKMIFGQEWAQSVSVKVFGKTELD